MTTWRMKMPDLQSELSKLLNQKQFDDEPGAPVIQTITADGNSNHRIFEYVVKNPAATALQIANALGKHQNNVSTVLKSFTDKGLMRRAKPHMGSFEYTATVDKYPAFDRVAHIKNNMAIARKKAAEARKAAPPKKKVVVVKRKPEPAQPAPQPAAKLEVDTILESINIIQARELLNKLNILFGKLS